MTPFLRWLPPSSKRLAIAGAPLAAAAVPTHDPPLQPRDEAIFLLQLAAEVEHALLVQYLFALYSVRLSGFVGSNVPANADVLCSDWQQTIKIIALQEMGHFITVQNILLFLGGPLHFERPIFPHKSDFYPFAFELEPLTKDSLAKYVTAEAPEMRPNALMREIIFRARGADAGHYVNRVGALYEAIRAFFSPRGPLTDDDCDFTSLPSQADPAHWTFHAPPDFIVRQINSRQDAETALKEIAEQGEGPTSSGSASGSHFDAFLNIYFNATTPADSFPESDPSIEPVQWTATFPVQRNPVVSQNEAALGPNQNAVKEPFAKAWCQLFNLRYRRLLGCLSHYLYESGNSTERQKLVDEVRFDMRQSLARIAKTLVTLPGVVGGADNAGPPFEIDYDVTLPHGSVNRWRLERDIILASQGLITELRRYPLSTEQAGILNAIETNDTAFLRFVRQHLP